MNSETESRHLREDLRKIAIATILGGGLGFFTDKVTTFEALILVIAGGTMWIVALIDRQKES